MASKINSANESNSISTMEDKTSELPGSLPVKIVEAGGGGDCFYFSVFEALQNKGLLDIVSNTFKIPKDKDGFNLGFRKVLSDSLDDDLKVLIKEVCNVLVSGDPIDGILSEQPGYLATILGSMNLGCLDDIKPILIRIKEAIKQRGTWAGQIEVAKAKELLEGYCGIYLDIKKRRLYRLFNFDNRIVLFNDGNGRHFQWFKLGAAGGSRRTMRNKRGKNLKTRKQQQQKGGFFTALDKARVQAAAAGSQKHIQHCISQLKRFSPCIKRDRIRSYQFFYNLGRLQELLRETEHPKIWWSPIEALVAGNRYEELPRHVDSLREFIGVPYDEALIAKSC
jgi:hypothetical protein